MSCNLSVIIPAYNRASKIGAALDSVLRQTLEDIEIIVVDDGSTDDTVEVVKAYQKQHENIHLFETAHLGLGAACNTGIEHAQGKYTIFLDPDGWVPENGYLALYKLAEARDADVVIGQMMFKADDTPWTVMPSSRDLFDLYGDQSCAGSFLSPAQNPESVNKLVRTSLLLEHGIRFPDHGRTAEDLFYSVALFEHAKSAYITDEIVYMRDIGVASEQDIPIAPPDPEALVEGLNMLTQLGLRFHKLGQTDAQAWVLDGSFSSIWERFWLLQDPRQQEAVFAAVKAYLSLYKGLPEYQVSIRHMTWMDLDTVLVLPFITYQRQREYLAPPVIAAEQAEELPLEILEPPLDQVLELYREGQAGLRYVLKYFAAWIKYKLH